MKFTCLKTVFPSLPKKLRKSPPPPPHARTQASILNSRRGHNEDTSSTSLKYYIQDITIVGLQTSCVIKNLRKASNIKVLKFIDQNSALGCLSDQRLTKNQPRKTFSQNIYNICRRVLSSHWPPEPSNAPPTSILLLLLPWVLQNNT